MLSSALASAREVCAPSQEAQAGIDTAARFIAHELALRSSKFNEPRFLDDVQNPRQEQQI